MLSLRKEIRWNVRKSLNKVPLTLSGPVGVIQRDPSVYIESVVGKSLEHIVAILTEIHVKGARLPKREYKVGNFLNLKLILDLHEAEFTELLLLECCE
jgi:hypothetical protein